MGHLRKSNRAWLTASLLCLTISCAAGHGKLLSQWETETSSSSEHFSQEDQIQQLAIPEQDSDKEASQPLDTTATTEPSKLASETALHAGPEHPQPMDAIKVAPPPRRQADVQLTPEQIAAELELTLFHFTSELRMTTKQQKKRKKAKRKKWPKGISSVWIRVLDELQSGLAIPDDDLMPKRVLLQAHVTTAAEKELTERHFGACPEALNWRIKDLHQQIHRLLQRNVLADGPLPPAPTQPGQGPKLEWPVAPQIYTSLFGMRRDPLNGARKFHTGIDLGADRGSVVSSAANGRVIHAGWAGGYGRMVVVQHIGGYQTVYAHLGKILVPVGVKVDGGAPLGLVGSSGRSTGPHLHFELRYGGRPIDPMKLFKRRYAVRLSKEPANPPISHSNHQH
ncbi:MAG: M23 family metallopeptidase [Myxococcota bacterium]|nr:M23 family metallopeptidase [Myxococcota bacterium]